jgi:hypothetical protein
VSSLTLNQAKIIAAAAYGKYLLPTDFLNLNGNKSLFGQIDFLDKYETPEQTLKFIAQNILFQGPIEFPEKFPGFKIVLTESATLTEEITERFPSNMIVNFFFPNTSTDTKAAMTAAIDTGLISKVNFVLGAVKLVTTIASPTLVDVIKAATTEGVPQGYMDSGLHMPGINSSQQDFLVAMYDSVFNRAPEFAGIKYWANKLSIELGSGVDQATAYANISKQMYIDGKGNNEGGTNLVDTAYVDYAYQNILGRKGEAAGIQYWNNQLSTGAVDRGGFVAKFVSDALRNTGDSDLLVARIAVSKFAAQENVSGANAPGIDLHAVIQNVTDAASANSSITAIIQKYGTTPSSTSSLIPLLSSLNDTSFASNEPSYDYAALAAVELTGAVTNTSTFDISGFSA